MGLSLCQFLVLQNVSKFPYFLVHSILEVREDTHVIPDGWHKFQDVRHTTLAQSRESEVGSEFWD